MLQADTPVGYPGGTEMKTSVGGAAEGINSPQSTAVSTEELIQC